MDPRIEIIVPVRMTYRRPRHRAAECTLVTRQVVDLAEVAAGHITPSVTAGRQAVFTDGESFWRPVRAEQFLADMTGRFEDNPLSSGASWGVRATVEDFDPARLDAWIDDRNSLIAGFMADHRLCDGAIFRRCTPFVKGNGESFSFSTTEETRDRFAGMRAQTYHLGLGQSFPELALPLADGLDVLSDVVIHDMPAAALEANRYQIAPATLAGVMEAIHNLTGHRAEDLSGPDQFRRLRAIAQSVDGVVSGERFVADRVHDADRAAQCAAEEAGDLLPQNVKDFLPFAARALAQWRPCRDDEEHHPFVYGRRKLPSLNWQSAGPAPDVIDAEDADIIAGMIP